MPDMKQQKGQVVVTLQLVLFSRDCKSAVAR
jgi:hypothetical protein